MRALLQHQDQARSQDRRLGFRGAERCSDDIDADTARCANASSGRFRGRALDARQPAYAADTDHFPHRQQQSQDAVIKGYASGAVDYLFKPFDPQILKPKVQALLEHQRNRRALQRLSHDLEVARAFNASVLDNAARRHSGVEQGWRDRFANPAISRLLNAPIEGSGRQGVSRFPAEATHSPVGRFRVLRRLPTRGNPAPA